MGQVPHPNRRRRPRAYRQLPVPTAGYAPSDETQISLTLTPPVGKDNIVPLDVTLKTVVLRQPRVRLAAYGSASGVAGLKEGTALLGRVGATFQGCFDITIEPQRVFQSCLS